MFRSLQACRAVAACLVVLFHLGGTFAQDRYFGFKAIDGPFAWGDSGVEFFFVLSGFLITFVHRGDFGRPQALGGYLVKRLLRIYPTYWLVCAAVCAAAWFAPGLRGALPDSLGVFVKALALLPQDPSVVGGTGAPILFVAWSLQYEVLFYALIAIVILSRSAGLVAAAALVALNLSCHVGASCGWPLSFFSDNLILMFGMGVACAYLVRSPLRLPHPGATALVAAIAFVVFGLVEVSHGRELFGVDRRLVYGTLAALMLLGLTQAEDAGRLAWLGQRWIRHLGDASYALYLLHIPVISVACKLILKLGVSNHLALTVLYALVFLTCVGVSVLFHAGVERPLLAWLRQRLERRVDARSGVAATPIRPASLDSRYDDTRPRRAHDVRWQ